MLSRTPVAVVLLSAATLLAQTSKVDASAHLVSTPLSFIPNQGQSASPVDFTASGSGYSIALSHGSAVLGLSPAPASKLRTTVADLPPREFITMALQGAAERPTPEPEVKLPGTANFLSGRDESKWHRDVPTYARARYSGVYPGIDLVYYGNQRELEYDFRVAAGADPGAIRLVFGGARATVSKSGDLVLITNGGHTVRFEKPVVYQPATATAAKLPVKGSFQLASNGNVRFRLGAYDHSRELVIDPVLSYASFIGGNEFDQIYGSAVSPQGYLYITGYTSYYQSGAVIYPTTKGAFQPNCNWCLNGQNSAFVTKFSADGKTLLYSTFLEGTYKPTQCAGQCPGSTAGNAIAVSVDDEAYVFGTTFDDDFPVVNPIQAVCRPSNENAEQCQGVYGGEASGAASFFVTRLNSAGNGLLYSTFFGNNSGGYPTSIALDSNKNIILSGSAYGAFPCPGNCGNGANLPITQNGYQSSFTTDESVPFITEISADGQRYLYSTWLGGNTFCGSGNGTCQSYAGQAVGANGLIYATGSTEAIDFPVTSNAYQKSCDGNNGSPDTCAETNGYLAIFDPAASTGAASAKTVTYIHGPTSGVNGAADVYLQGIAVDPSGNIFLSGETSDQKFPVTTTNGIVFSYNVPTSAIDIKMNSTGTSLLKAAWMGVPPGGNLNAPSYIATDGSGNVYTLFNNGNPGVSGGAIPLVHAVQSNQPGQDLVIAEQSNDLSTVEFSTYMGGSATITPEGISLDAARNIYAAGETPYQGSDFTTSSGAYQTTYPGGEQKGIVEKVGELFDTPALNVSISPETLYASSTATIQATVTGSSGTPTGNVAFYVDGQLLGTAALSHGSVSVSESANVHGTGTHSIQVLYLGNASYGGAVFTATGIVNAVPTKTVLTFSPTTIPANGAIHATATVTRTEGSGTPTGSVQFCANGDCLASVPLENGVATLNANAPSDPAGKYSVTAHYVGDSTDAPSTSNAVSVTYQ